MVYSLKYLLLHLFFIRESTSSHCSVSDQIQNTGEMVAIPLMNILECGKSRFWQCF